MAWIKNRERKDGTVYFAVMFREHGKQTSLSWDDYADAQHCQQLIDSLGPEKAREIMRIVAEPRQSLTLTQYLTRYVGRLTGLQRGTVARYRSYIANDIEAGMGQIPLAVLSRDDIAGWIEAMSHQSGKTVANKHGFLAGALNAAVRDGLIKANPCDGNKLPRWDRKQMELLTRDEYTLLLGDIPDYWKPLVTFLVASGCRWSEATALQPGDINIKDSTVRITKAWKTGAGGYVLGVPKTKKSVRTINVPATVLAQLDLSGEWVFTNSGRGRGKFADGTVPDDERPVRIHSFHPNVWRPALARARKQGLTRDVRVHDLRHTCASWLIAAGRPLPAIQAHMGHESIQTTVDIYGHLDRSSGQENADAIGAMLS